VGDDWQAVNGFAGSDLKYFTDYEKHYSGTSRRNILINYRSGSRIVEAGNCLMKGLGEKSQWDLSNANKGSVEIVNIEKYHIEGRNNQEDTEQYSADKKYIQACEIKIPTKDGNEWIITDYDTARYIKAIHRILNENTALLAKKDTKCFVLGRRNRFGCFKSADVFKEKLLEVFSKEEKEHIGRNRIAEKIHVMTAHKSKGKEADIVFILECNERSFPMVHPDNRLFGIFGETEQKVLEEEKRLFYVALTRAKQKVYLLTEADNKSPFLSEIGDLK
jgi:DNA helicase-4